ncbi:MAG TPA: porin family protein [Bacteroidales bacterium]|nr:porin family protein [Bacteroidales bacterium]
MKNHKVLRALLIIMTILFGAGLKAQVNKVPNLKLYDYETLHFGFIISGNQMNFVITPVSNLHQLYFKGRELPESDLGLSTSTDVDSAQVYGILSEPTVGFTVGIVGDLRLGEYFNLRFIPSLAFGRRDLNYDTRLFRGSDTITSMVLKQKIQSTFIEFPFLLKYKSKRVHNFRAYVTGGVKFSFDLASQVKKTEKNNYEPKLFRTDTYGVLGGGIEFYMNWFKLGVELTMSYGSRDMLLREGNMYTNSIESLRSKIFMFTFTFE